MRARTTKGRIASVLAVVLAVGVGIALGTARRDASRTAVASGACATRTAGPVQIGRKTTTVGHPVELRAHVGRSTGGSAPKETTVRLDVLGVTDPAPVPAGSTLPTGFSLVTVRAQACATSIPVNPFFAFSNFDVITTGGHHVFLTPKITVPGELSILAKNIEPGACETSVVPFEVPSSTPLEAVGYPTFAQSVRWSLPR